MTADIISILSNLSGAVATVIIFIWFLKDYLDKTNKTSLELNRTLQKLTDVIIEQNKSIDELRHVIQKMYLFQIEQSKKIKLYEKKMAK